MILSMTGYGQSELTLFNKKYSIAVKTLNSKNLDLNIRLGQELRAFEPQMRQEISARLKRGKVDVYVNSSSLEGNAEIQINENLIYEFIRKFKSIDPGIDENTAFKQAMRMPDVISTPNIEFSEEDEKNFFEAFFLALENVNEFRQKEGKELQDDFEKRIQKIRELSLEVNKYEAERVALIRDRLQTAIEEIEEVDRNRFEQELIYYLEKLDITEEKVRLENHCKYFLETMNLPDSNGKKLNFIVQEIGREINTMGSKSNHATMQKLVVDMKDELEKIKEQILNIL